MTTLVLEHLQHADSASPDITIDSSGRVGIGTASPAKKFHVHSGNQSDIVKFENDNGGFVLGKTANLGSLDMASDANFRIRHGSTLSATFKSNGYVGIGETNPQYLLHLAKSGSNYIQIDNDTNSVTSFLGVATDHLWLGTSTNHQLKFYANSDIKMVIDTNGNVGIGTQSAIDKFNVETSSTQTHSTTLTKGTNTPGAWITNSNNDNNMSGLHLATGSGTHFSSIVGARTANASHWGTHLAFYTHDHNTSNLNTATEKMRISGDGYVTKPNQPSFMAHKTSHLSLSGAGQVEGGSWSTTYLNGGHNTGGHFNTTSGRFTVPVAGRYKFDANIMHGITSGDFQIWLCVNGNTSTCVRSNSMQSAGGNWKQTTVTGIFNLAANDYISIFVRSSAAEPYAMYGSTTGAFTTCNGYLIG